MKTKKKFYGGNYPNSPDYDPSLPIGYIKWDAPEPPEEELTEDENYNEENNLNDNEE